VALTAEGAPGAVDTAVTKRLAGMNLTAVRTGVVLRPSATTEVVSARLDLTDLATTVNDIASDRAGAAIDPALSGLFAAQVTFEVPFLVFTTTQLSAPLFAVTPSGRYTTAVGRLMVAAPSLTITTLTLEVLPYLSAGITVTAP
jgi:hypothetical protein